MARAVVALRQPGRRPSRTGTLVAVCVALLSALAVCFGVGPAAFALSLASRSRLRGGARSIRVACAARGRKAAVAEEYRVGDKVKALSEDDGQWYPGKIDSVANDGTYTVKWDDPDGGPETAEVGADGLKQIVIFKDYAVGDDCEAESPDDSTWYPGTVSAINKDGTFTVTWDDPDGGPETANIEPDKMKKVTVFKGYKEGDEVLAVFPDDGEWYSAIVKAVKAEGTFVVKWDDPDGGPEESELIPKKMKLPPIPLDKLEVGAKYTGKVRSVRDFGAFVDFGAAVDGLVHVSRVTGERVASIYDHVEEGQEVDVWVTEVRDDGKVGLSMVEGLGSGRGGRGSYDYAAFDGISPSEWLEGTVTKVAPFGAFVLVRSPGGAEANGLVHVSAIRDGYVEDVSSELREGDKVKVRVVRLDLDQGKISLSMKEEMSGMAGASRLPADLSSFEKMSPDEWVDGKVARIQSFGAFVTVALEDGSSADGLVHITQIKDGFVESVEDELEIGQDVKVRIVSVDPAAGKMSLSMKGE